MSVDKKIKYQDQRLTASEKKKIKPANQGGGPNYLGKQKTVTVPKKWLSDPDHVVAELAYITPREQKILLDANIYGSLKGKPNKGPGGIMSLQGDLGGYDASPGGPDDEKGNPGASTDDKAKAADIMTGKVNVTSPTGITEGYTGPEGVRDSFGNYVGQKYVGKGLFGLGSGYRDVYTKGPRQGQVKPGILGRVLGGIGSLVTGIPFVGSALGTMYDYGKGIFGLKDYYEGMDEEEKDRIANLQLIDGQLVDTRNFEDTFGQRNEIVSSPSISNLDSFDRFNINYNPNQSIVDVEAVRAMIENAKNQGSS